MKQIWTTTERNARTMLGLAVDAPLEIVASARPIAGKLSLHVSVAPLKLYREVAARPLVGIPYTIVSG